MASSGKGATELLDYLESNNLDAVEEMKKVFHEHFLTIKDPWLVNGLFDYYLSTNSLRAVEVLVGVREPHDKYLLDRLAEALTKPASSGQSQRVQALTLLGHVVRRHPTWLYKLANHALFDKLLKLLKVDCEILALMSALLLLVTLLPMLRVSNPSFLNEIFEVFARLAQYHDQQSLALASASSAGSFVPDRKKEKLYLLHLQIGLESLFHRLYAMYPCNFVSFLRTQYASRDQFPTFTRVIRPMLDSVRMHPLLVTASKDTEISTSRWKQMEHHDVVAECERFTLERSWSDLQGQVVLQPPQKHPSIEFSSRSRGIISSHSSLMTKMVDDDSFWSPSMVMDPNSPPPHETRSTPSTPNNMRIGASPPEAAVEATPETTPVKDLRQLSTRQALPTSTAVRALSSFGNGLSGDSRPSTPNAGHSSSVTAASNKINKLFAERQSSQMASSHISLPMDMESTTDHIRGLRDLDAYLSQNGNDSWQEDQEVLEIVNSQNSSAVPTVRRSLQLEEKEQDDVISKNARTDLSRKVHRIRFYSQCQASLTYRTSSHSTEMRRTNSWPEIAMTSNDSMESMRLVRAQRNKVKITTEEASTQTHDVVPYEYLLLGIVSTGVYEQDQSIESISESRLSPDFMLQRYMQTCARGQYFTDHIKPKSGFVKHKQNPKRKGNDDDVLHEGAEDDGGDYLDAEGGNQALQLLQMQLQFERQRREVHAERNRRLLGKLRDSQALEEHNDALKNRLRILEKEADALRTELERTKREARQTEKRHMETNGVLQVQCAEEQQRSRELTKITEVLKLELEEERENVARGLRELRGAEAALFDAAHQLKAALRAANQGKMLKCAFDTLQKRYLLLGEVQLKLQEKTVGPTPMASQEAAQIQRSYAEELSSLRRQVESRNSLVEALRARLIELEGGEAQREALLTKQQQLLQEVKERHAAELEALESKYKTQRAIHLHLEGRVLELLGSLEEKSALASSGTTSTLTSISPKERSPPLSVSLASSSEGSIAFLHSGIMMSDCCDQAGEITNLQAIVDTSPSPSRNNQPHSST